MYKTPSDFLTKNDGAVLETIFDQSLSGADIPYNTSEKLEHLKDDDGELTPAVERSIKQELEAIEAAEKKDYEKACDLFEIAINLAPHRAAPYNNRAQVYRILGDNDAALEDLEIAIKLSKSSGRTGCRALCQRGCIRRLTNDNEGAKEDFNKAAKLGSPFAKKQLVEMNPYAQLCNQALTKLQNEIN